MPYIIAPMFIIFFARSYTFTLLQFDLVMSFENRHVLPLNQGFRLLISRQEGNLTV